MVLVVNKDKSFNIIGNNYFIAVTYLFILLIFFNKIIIHPDWIVFGTDTMDRVSITAYIRDMALNNGEFPLWIPVHFSGLPHIDATHSIQFNIFCLLYYIMPLPLAFNLFMIIHFFFAGFFTYIFAKGIGLKKSGAFISGLIFMFSGVLISHMFVGHMAKIVTWAYLPLILFLVGSGIEKRRLIYFLIAGLVMGHQFIGGHMQMAYYSTLFVCVYSLFNIYCYRQKGGKWDKWLLKPGVYFVISAMIAVLLYSVQLVPSYLYTQKYSERAGGTTYEFSTSWSFAPKELPGIILRDPFGWGWPKTEERIKSSGVVKLEGSFPEPFVPYWGPMPQRLAGEYFGILPFILAIVGISFRRNRISWFFSGGAILTLLLSMGKYTPVYWLAYKLVFGFSFFRVPLSIFALTAFCLSILAGLGSDFLLSEKSDKEAAFIKRFTIISVGIGVIVVVITLYINMSGENLLSYFMSAYDRPRFGQYITDFRQLAMDRLVNMQKILNVFSFYVFASIAFLYLLLRKKLNSIAALCIMLLLIISDLWAYGYDYIKYADINADSFYGKYETVKVLNEETKGGKFRTFAWDDRSIPDASVNLRSFSYHGIELINGRHDLAPIYYRQILNVALRRPELMSLLNTKYILVTANNDIRRLLRGVPGLDEKFPLIAEDEKFKLYKNKSVLNRAFIVNRVRVVSEDKYVLGYMAKDSFDPAVDVVLEEKPVRPDGNVLEPSDANLAIIESYTPNRVTINAELKQEGILVLADTYYPDWKVYVDGVEGKIYKADYALRGVYLKAGLHKVEFVYDSKILKTTGSVSLVTLILTLVGIILIYWHERRAVAV